jgi:hypothetical protein
VRTRSVDSPARTRESRRDEQDDRNQSDVMGGRDAEEEGPQRNVMGGETAEERQREAESADEEESRPAGEGPDEGAV